MGDKSGIEWTDASWNPVTGCSKVSQGCKHCYAERDWARLSAPRTPPNIYTGRAFTDVAVHPERLDQPLKWAKPRRIFVNSMSDLFHEDIPDEFIDKVWGVMSLAPRHTFQILTKRPERMAEIIPKLAARHRPPDGSRWPLPNVWLGVSVEDQETADERIQRLLQTPAAVRWISAEPLLGPIDLIEAMGMRAPGSRYNGWADLHWVVVGGESGPKARPMHPEWARSLRDQCQAAGVPFLFKQWGEWSPACDYYTSDDELLDQATDGPHLLLTEHGHEWVVGDPGEGGRHDGQPPAGTWVMHRLGKKAAGRMLDGRTWNDYPL